MCETARGSVVWWRVIHRGGPLFLVYILFFLVCKSRKRFLKQYDTHGPCYRFMVCCYRFMVTSLQIYGHLLQKYGAIHRPAAAVRCCYSFMVWGSGPDQSRGSATEIWSTWFCYRFMVRASKRRSATDGFVLVKGMHHRNYIVCMTKQFRNKLQV